MKNKNRFNPWRILIATLCCVYVDTAISAHKADATTQYSQLNKNTVTLKRSKDQKSSEVVPIAPDLRKKLRKILKADGTRHLLAQFSRHPTTKEKVALAKLGLQLQGHLGTFLWRVTVTDVQVLAFADPTAVKREPVLGLLHSLGELRPQKKMTPQLLEEGVFPKHRHDDGTIEVRVGFHRDVSVEVLDKALRRQQARRVGKVGALNDTVVRVPEERLLALAGEDEVAWIELIGLGDSGSNDTSRAAIDADSVGIGSADNLTGNNVQVGIWDEGIVDASHNDLLGRVTTGSGEPPTVNMHATHVAGTLAGDGSQSVAAGGSANQWQGVAPSANLFSYSIAEDDDEPEEHDDAMATHGIDLSQNSWGIDPACFYLGWYRSRSEKYDDLVRGWYPTGSPRPLPVVVAAGNNGSPGTVCADAGTEPTTGTQIGTPRAPGANAKNPIVVGYVDSAAPHTLASQSSRGPTKYGMLKPDIVAPGCAGASCTTICSIGSCTTGIKSTVLGNSYDFGAGSSMATPAVSGTIALTLEQYRKTYFPPGSGDETPLPSTFKAILAHTAQDLGTAGPDYDHGYGLIDAHKAVDTIKEKRIAEGMLANAGDAHVYAIQVLPGDTELRVTLAWDDYPSTYDAATGLAQVENDLDLLVASPNHNEFYTPWILDPTNRIAPAVRHPPDPSEAAAGSHVDRENVIEQVVVTPPLLTPGLWKVKVKAYNFSNGPQSYSLVAGSNASHQLLGPEVDIMQVLDRSGSMSATAEAGGLDTKLEVLQSAAKLFIQLMATGEPHKLGLVQFNHNVVVFPDPTETDLQTLTPTRQTNLTTSGTSPIDAMTAGGATSIGDGLDSARTQLTSVSPLIADPHRVILLVTDGKENSAQMIADVQANLISDGVRVYPLGLGHGTGIDSGPLSSLATDTDGDFRITNDALEFEKFFIEVLAGAVDWSVSADPVHELAAGETVTIPVPVAYDETTAAFTAYWQDIAQAVELALITPSGELIQPSDAGGSIRYGDDPRFAFFKIDLPWEHHPEEDWEGTWQMRLTGSNRIPDGQKVRVSASGFVEGGNHLEVTFDKAVYRTGDTALATARVRRRHRPVVGAQVLLDCDIPTAGAGNILHDGQVDPTNLNPRVKVKGDNVNLVDQKLELLEKEAGKSLLTRGTLQLSLFDDGTHGDGNAGDGIYANSFSDTQLPGTFSCRFLATDLPTGRALKTQREWTIAFHNEVAIDADHSDINVRLVAQTADGYQYKVRVVPRDRFGNYLGPGYPANVRWQQPGSIPVPLGDPLVNGSYGNDIFLPGATANKDVRLLITVHDQSFATLRPPGLSPWSLSVHGGINDPRSNFGRNLNSGLSLGIDLEYRLNDTYAAEVFLGHDQFDGKSGFRDVDVTHFSLNGKRYFLPEATRPFASIGVGRYDLDPGPTKSGFNVGAGVQWDRPQRFAIEATLKFHSIDTSGSNSEFYTIHGGVRYRF